MSEEQKAPLPSETQRDTVSRRDFLRVPIAAGAGLAIQDAANRVVSALGLLGLRQELNQARTIFPGALEAQYTPKHDFIDKRAHLDWLSEMMDTPFFRENGKRMIPLLENNKENFHSYGDYLRFFIENTHGYLQELYKNVDIQVSIRYGLMTMAGMLNSWSSKELSQAGNYNKRFNLPEGTFDERFMEPRGPSRLFQQSGLFPGVGPNVAEINRFNRLDGSIHCTQHAFFTYMLEYSRKHNQPFHLQVPPGVSIMTEAGLTREVPSMIGHGYELFYDAKNIATGNNLKADNKYDLACNELGQDVGYALTSVTNWEGLSEIYTILNEPALRTPTAQPAVPTEIKQRLQVMIK